MLNQVVRQLIRPDEYVENIFHIDLQSLRRHGIKAILIDIDNTLLPYSENLPTIKTINWIQQVKAERFQVILITNKINKKRGRDIAEALGCEIFYLVGKPFHPAVRSIIENHLTASLSEAAIIGDQLLFDIVLGNLLAVYTILVNNCDSHRGYRQVSMLSRTKGKVLDRIING